MSEYRKFATRNKFGKKRKRARYNFEKGPDPAEEPSDDCLPAASSEGRGDSEVDSSEPRESELGLTVSPADGDRRSTVRHDTRMVPQAELLQRKKKAEDKLQRLAQTSATKRKLDMSASVNDGAHGPAETESRFFIPQPNSTCAKVWEKMTFAQDDDGKMTAKFRKLMGIRGDPPPPSDKPDPTVNPLLKQQEKLFQDLDQQYEAARVSTHTHRGVGLGYSSQMAAFFQQTNLNTK
ncbi:hypothetical protein HPB50_009043 [Hyalomma asiaticum]|uniref:Uncharacterized protein n=1 Tax=Hyalomma asiaticum TaxID=266040 RepID=A0ACB7SHV5_HYAAI|nr:hypothetical protein HPB50_009043 [Hyalomma asiaticum]